MKRTAAMIAAELLEGLDELEATLEAGVRGEWPPTAAEQLAIFASDLLHTAAGERAEADDEASRLLLAATAEAAALVVGAS